MALYRQLQVKFWQDGFVLDLTPEEKFFYAYLMTNSKTTQCGIFELPKRIIEMETGYNRETVDKLIKRFVDYGKIYYSQETKEIMVKNWIKYNFINSKNTILCINKELKEIKNTEFVFKLYDICRELNYPLEIIFEGIHEVENNLSEDVNSEIFEQSTSLTEKEEEFQETEEIFEENENIEGNKDLEKITENIDFKEVVKTFNNNIHPITPIEYEKLKVWEEDVQCDAIILAIKEAVNHNARTLSYINSILNNWYNLGLYSVEAINAYQRDWNSKNKKDKNESMANAEAYMYVE